MSDSLSAREILDRLVSFPTVSRESNLDLIDWVEGYLDDLGVSGHRVWNADRTKANLYAHVGPDVPGGVILSGHTDVVPIDGQTWSTDPWIVTARDGRLHGRGTCDMKGFDALALAAVPMALRAGVRRPLQIALSYDEEVGCIGAPSMIGEMARHLPRAAAVVVGEPSMMKAVTGQKGGLGFLVHLRGREVHSSRLPYGVSAIMEAGRMIEWVNARNAENRAATPSAVAADFDPPWTTVHVGTIAGGTAANITAKDCRLSIDIRMVPGEEPEAWERALRARAAEVEAGMKAVHPDCAVTVEHTFTVPPLTPETGGRAEALARELTGDNGRNAVSYGTEGGQFQAEGYSTVICGPGDIAQAHQPDEFITAAQFRAGEAFMERLVQRLAAADA